MKHDTLPIHPYLTDPRTGVPLRAVGIGKRGPIWPILGASEGAPEGANGGSGGSGNGSGSGGDGGQSAQGGQASQGGQSGQNGATAVGGGSSATGGSGGAAGSGTDKGFPDNTPIAQMTPEQQTAYWKYHARKHEQVANARADYDEMRRKADEYDKYQAANATEHEKAVKAAVDAARSEERGKTRDQLVAAEFKAAAAGRIEAERLTEILEPLDMGKFVDSNGEVDTVKVATYVEGIAPKQDPKKKTFPDMGQGRRDGGAGPSVAAGRDLYEQRHGAKQKQSQ